MSGIEQSMWKWLKSRLWDVDAVVWGAPEIFGIHYKVPWLRRVARLLGREYELVIVALVALVVTIVAHWR
jgi:hypothetical protein